MGGAVYSLAVPIPLAGSARAATVVRLSWSATSESDLAGYRLLYGTDSGAYIDTVDVGRVTSCSVQGLDSSSTFCFALKAYDFSGNVNDPSAVADLGADINRSCQIDTIDLDARGWQR